MNGTPQQRATPAGASALAAERRAWVRHRFPPGRTCGFVAWPDCTGRRAALYDISTRGLGIIVEEPPAVGCDIVVQLSNPGESGARSVSGRVAHAMRLPGGHWLVGCALWRPLSEDEVAALL